jgi:DNA repair protein RecN (Recombination protein N)
MVLSALNLLLGKRGSNKMIYKDASMLSVEGCWNLSNSSHQAEIEETGAVIEDDQLYINRTIKDDGKSRSVVGGKTTPASVLSNIGGKLVNIHGQSDQIRLRNTNAQREALDKYAGEALQKELTKFLKAFREWKAKKAYIEDITTNASQRKREISSIRAFITDFDNVAPTEGQDVELAKQIAALSNMDTIRISSNEALESLIPSNEEIPSATEQLRTFISSLSRIASYDPELESIHEKAEALGADLEELTDSLESFIRGLDEESIEQLYVAQEQEIAIKNLVRKYGSSLQEVIEQRDKAEEELEELESYNQPLEDLNAELEVLHEKMTVAAQRVTDLREKAARKMEKEVNDELKGLSMSGSKLLIQISKTSPSNTGQDEVELMLQSNGSATPNPIAKSASGGELSRIMLALEVVLADPKSTGTFIFDEVDSGVGGETAIEIGKRLALLAKEAQVIVVTHLPQVAAYGDNHLKVLKTVTEGTTETTVQQLSSKERIDEITRMLSGMSDSETGKAHAAELIEHAESFKN